MAALFAEPSEWRCQSYNQFSTDAFYLAPPFEYDALADLINGHSYFLDQDGERFRGVGSAAG